MTDVVAFVASAIFLLVAMTSLVIQFVSLHRIRKQTGADSPARRLAAKGLRRTSASRVAAALIYLMLAIGSLYFPEDMGISAVVVFTLVQFIWWTNAILDVRLRRTLADPQSRRGRHRA